MFACIILLFVAYSAILSGAAPDSGCSPKDKQLRDKILEAVHDAGYPTVEYVCQLEKYAAGQEQIGVKLISQEGGKIGDTKEDFVDDLGWRSFLKTAGKVDQIGCHISAAGSGKQWKITCACTTA